MKRRIIIIFTLVLCACLTACAEKHKAEDDFRVAPDSLKDNKSLGVRSYVGKSQAVRIPSRLYGTPVTFVGNSAFKGKEIISVTIPSGVTLIGGEAFANNLLTSVTIPNSVSTIGMSAFQDNQLAGVVIPPGARLIWNGAFRDNNLTSIAIPDGTKVIMEYTFAENLLTSVTLPDSVTAIGKYAFAENQLSSVTIPAGMSAIADYAFAENLLTSVTLPDSVTTIGEGAFNANRLTGITIPESVTTIGVNAFKNNQLTSITFPYSVVDIGRDAFTENPVTSVTIGAAVAGVGPSRNAVRDSAYSFPGFYNQNGRKAGTYTYNNERWNFAPVGSVPDVPAAAFLPDFAGTWKRDDSFDNTLTFTANTLQSSSQSTLWYCTNTSGDSYTIWTQGCADSFGKLTITLIDGNLAIRGDSGEGQDNWNGSWRKQ